MKIDVWIAGDENGLLAFYAEKPYRGKSVWLGSSYHFAIPSDLFPEITWESEPVKKTLTIE